MRVSWDGFEVDLEGYRLRRHGQLIALEPRTFDLLAYLILRLLLPATS